jgi:hypothetical protein
VTLLIVPVLGKGTGALKTPCGFFLVTLVFTYTGKGGSSSLGAGLLHRGTGVGDENGRRIEGRD